VASLDVAGVVERYRADATRRSEGVLVHA
jgi:hypothetical protein